MNRRIRIEQGEDLRTVAMRDLGDPTRWAEIASLNDLRLPFVVASWKEADRLPHTVIWGDEILIPRRDRVVARTAASTFGVDLDLSGGVLSAVGGDFALVSGAENLVQALSLRLKTPRGELTYHMRYGCHAVLAIGLPTVPFASLMAAAWVYEALREEPRLARVVGTDARVDGDTVRVVARVVATDANTPTDFNLVLSA